MTRPFADRTLALAAVAEVFREHGYEGASLARIEAATGLGKGSLYHLFPDGKAQMADEVLADIAGWFEREVFAPLRDIADPGEGIETMLNTVEAYFCSGRRVCLVGAFALDATRDRFGQAIRGYFERWIAGLSTALAHAGHPDPGVQAEEIVGNIQGALVLARALGDPRVFSRRLGEIRSRFALLGKGPAQSEAPTSFAARCGRPMSSG